MGTGRPAAALVGPGVGLAVAVAVGDAPAPSGVPAGGGSEGTVGRGTATGSPFEPASGWRRATTDITSGPR